MKITTKEINGKWTEYTLTNHHGLSVSILNKGGIITKLHTADRNGKLENIVLGFQNYDLYEKNPVYFGAIIGRVAGRIQGASFTLENQTYKLEANNGENHLHSASNGFHNAIWDVHPFQTEDSVGVKLSYTSVDGEGGYPGTVNASVIYTLTNRNQLILDYTATGNKRTPLTLTNHSYFNLTGNAKQTVRDHVVKVASSRFVELDSHLIPTGTIVDVSSTPFDFRSGEVLGTGFNAFHEQNAIAGNGYDHYFIFDEVKGDQVHVEEPVSGRTMSIQTNELGMVMYTSNTMTEGVPLIEGATKRYIGVCFETQGSPASLHHEGFPSILLNPGETYEKQTIFTFGVN